MLNLVVLSLESLSQTLFWQCREAMPTLWDLGARSTQFRRFYSNSTSSFQSFCDFVHGDGAELDHNPEFPGASGCLAGRSTNLFGILRDKGYEVLGLQRGSGSPGHAQGNRFGAWPESCGAFQHHSAQASFHAEIDAFLDAAKSGGKPFALYIADRAARTDDASPEKDGAVHYHERFEKGYSLLDETARRVMEKLSALAMLPNTLVVAYGPYGMDPWKHGVNAGRTTGIAPYADVSWTPLLIYNNGVDVVIADQLFSVIDLKPTLLHMLFPDERQPQHRNVLSGVDILSYRRQTVLTQSMFALETENGGGMKGLPKSYSATDGDNRLIVTSGEALASEGGMELYFDPRDPGNTRNFLDFFEIDQNGGMTAFGCKDIVHVHFTQSFKPNLVMSIANSYNTLREQLYGFIRLKESEALALAGPGLERNRFPDKAFTLKRKWK